MVFRFFGGKGSERLEAIESKVQEMLTHDRHEFDLAMNALLGRTPPAAVNDELRQTDRKVNRLEREIRRELVVHASVFGGIDTPAVLVYMSVVKDMERVGDYAKNLLDLALDGADFSRAPDAEEWERLAREIARMIDDAAAAFKVRDAARSRQLLAQGDELLNLFDDRVTALIKEEVPSAQPVPRALAHRYLKRVVAHLMNLLSAVTMPVDKIDYFDEDPEDRDIAS